MKKKRAILLAAGGTGGHLFPAIAIAEELLKIQSPNNHYNNNITDIHLITDLRCQKYLTDDLSFNIHIVDLHLSMFGFINKIKSVIKLLRACIKTAILLRKIKPDIVIGFGGYPSFPSLLAARLFRIPIIIQEQNCFLGKTNCYFARYAKLIALSYEKTKNIDTKLKSKLLFTGDVVRSNIQNLVEKNNFYNKDFHLFVFGGSQGAKIFSDLVPKAIEKLKIINPSIDISVTQQAKKEDQNKLAEFYKKLNVTYEISDFFHNISEIYNKSQLVIARSGASTIAELSNIGLPAIFIPYPYAADNHQYFNAKDLENSNASWCYAQKDISSLILAEKINELITNRDLLTQASKNLLSRKTNGARHLADTVLKIIE